MQRLKKFKVKKSFKTVFSPDGKRLATIGNNVVIWDIVTRKKKLNESPLTNPSDLAFSPDGNQLAVKNTAGEIVILDSNTGKIVSDFDNLDGEGSNIQYSKCGLFLVDGSWSGQLFVREVETGKIVAKESFMGEMITRILRSGDGKIWIIEHSPKATSDTAPPPPCYLSIFKWPFNKSSLEIFPKRFPFIWSTAVNNDFTKIAIAHGNPNRYLEIIDLKAERKIIKTEIVLGGTGAALSWSNNGVMLASVQDRKVVIYLTDNLEIVDQIQYEYPSDVSFSPDGKYLAIGAWREGIVISLPVAAQPSGGGFFGESGQAV